MIAGLALVAYVAGYVWTWRRVGYNLAHDGFGKPDGEDIMFGLIFGAFVAIVWPIALVFMAISSFSKDGRGFLLPSRSKRHELELNARDARIAELEQEVGMKR